ncbi:MAG TPA: carboxypeptidase regulatory-like domain-containing protein [Longimicrobium sp.]|nr:carboxypeptidase regulatory-like domain-containing protein [Longimicrobium sp.]
MRKVVLTVAAVALLAIVWALLPSRPEGEGGARESTRADSSRAPGPSALANPGTTRPAGGENAAPAAPDRKAPTADGQVEVRVTAKGQPRAGARVRLYWRGPMDPNTNAIDWRLAGEGTSGPDGVVRVPTGPGMYLVSVRADGFAPMRREVIRPVGEPLTRADVALVAGVNLRARTVTKRSQEPIPLVEVRFIASARSGEGARPVAPMEEQTIATSDGRGQLQLSGLAPGTYRVEARSVGYAPWAKNDIQVPYPGELLISLHGAGVLEGFVVDASGRPAAGATVTVIGDEEPAVVTTGEGGGFSAEVEGGTYQLAARRGNDTGALLKPLVVPSGATVGGLRLELRAAGAIFGKVVSAADGLPVPGAVVAVSPYLKAGDTGRTTSGVDGSYVVEGVPPGSYDVVVTAPGYSELSRRGITVTSSQRFPLELKLKGTGGVEGVVLDSANRPVAGATVREAVRWSGGVLVGTPPEARSDAQGRYRLMGLGVGASRLVARREGADAAGAMQEVEIKEGQTAKADFTLTDAGVVEGRVTRKGGGPAAPWRVLAAPQLRASGWNRSNVVVGADGNYRLELAPGPYSLMVGPVDLSSWNPGERVSVTVEAGKVQRVDLTAPDDEGGRALSGVVMEPDGTPSPGAEVFASSGEGGRSFATADGEGRFSVRLSRSAPDAMVHVVAENGGRKGDMNVRADEPNVRLLLKPSAVLRGQVLSDAGPVTGFTLQLGASRRRMRDERGLEFSGNRYEVFDVPSGPVRVVVRTTDGRRGEAEGHIYGQETELDVTVEGGATLTGRVVDSLTRKPLAEGFASVRAGAGRDGEFSRLSPDGTFKLEHVPAGTHQLSVWAPMRKALEREVTLVAGQTVDVGEVSLDSMTAEPGSIGAQLREAGGQVSIDWILPNGPAQRAGVRVGDVLVAVDGVQVKSMVEALGRIRGAPGAAVLLTIRRSGTEQTVPVNRAG